MLLTQTLKLSASDRVRAVETKKSYAITWFKKIYFFPKSQCKMYEIDDRYYRWIIEIPPPRDFYCDTQVMLCKFLYFHSTCFCTVVHIHPMMFCEDGFFVGMSVNFYSSFSIENEIKLNHYSGRKLVTLKLFTLSHDEDWEYSNRNIAFIT